MDKSTLTTRLPAEWEPQDAILLAWPDSETDWQPILPQIQGVYLELIRAISAYEKIILVCRNVETVRQQLSRQNISSCQIIFTQAATNDTWCRDFGPLTIFRDGKPVLLDFTFNGWGNKFPACLDNQITSLLHQSGVFGSTTRQAINLVLEGGSIESDGRGTILTTSACLLNPNRNPRLSKAMLEDSLHQQFGAAKVLWLDHGFLIGDDTDSHIDTLARLCPAETILYVRCTDKNDKHYAELKKMEQQLKELRTINGAPYKLLPLPWPQPVFDATGERLPATYANYLVINQAVLVPTYQDPADKQALSVIAKAYPDRDIIPIDCRTIIQQHGSLHCLTMQIPQGVLP